jgi:hypothetical protein
MLAAARSFRQSSATLALSSCSASLVRRYSTARAIDFTVNRPPSSVFPRSRELKLQHCWTEPSQLFEHYKSQRKDVYRFKRLAKKVRRVELGPYSSVCFENFDMWWIQGAQDWVLPLLGVHQLPSPC